MYLFACKKMETGTYFASKQAIYRHMESPFRKRLQRYKKLYEFCSDKDKKP